MQGLVSTSGLPGLSKALFGPVVEVFREKVQQSKRTMKNGNHQDAEFISEFQRNKFLWMIKAEHILELLAIAFF